MISGDTSFQVEKAFVRILADKAGAGKAAATQAIPIVAQAVRTKGQARIIVGTGASQLELVQCLVESPDLDWRSIEVFHMDEYVGLASDHPASFRGWLREHVVEKAPVKQVHYLSGEVEDLQAECRRYGEEIARSPIDVVFIGFGENGHIAFNDPHVADFRDPLPVKRVEMDRVCRMQQVGEGAFPDLESVPREALTLTIPTLFECEHLICTVPEQRKAEAVRKAILGEVTPDCPASIVRTHPRCWIFLDGDSASLLDEDFLENHRDRE